MTDEEDCATWTPEKQKPVALCEEDLEEDGDFDWEDFDPDKIELAHTPQKTTPQSPGPPSPASKKIYDAAFLLQFNSQPPNLRVKQLILDNPPQHMPPPPPEKEKEDPDKRKGTKKPRDIFGDRVEQRERPFANLMSTNDNRPVMVDPNAPASTHPHGFFQPINAAPAPGPGRPGFGTAQPFSARQRQQQQALAKLDHRAADPFKATPADTQTKECIKKVQGVLNKITAEKYDRLFDNMWDELMVFNLFDPNDKEAMAVLDDVISLVFEKALAEPAFSAMYADVAQHLCDRATAACPTTTGGGKPLVHFRKMLLDRCQRQFQATLGDLPEDPEERLRLEARHRKRGLGNIKFIAELFKRNLLTEKIMHEVIKHLLLGPLPHPEDHSPSGEEVEVLCKLWQTAGRMLDRPEAADYINYYFNRMEHLSQNFSQMRHRCLLQDSLELRANGWAPRRKVGAPSDTETR